MSEIRTGYQHQQHNKQHATHGLQLPVTTHVQAVSSATCSRTRRHAGAGLCTILPSVRRCIAGLPFHVLGVHQEVIVSSSPQTDSDISSHQKNRLIHSISCPLHESHRVGTTSVLLSLDVQSNATQSVQGHIQAVSLKNSTQRHANPG